MDKNKNKIGKKIKPRTVAIVLVGMIVLVLYGYYLVYPKFIEYRKAIINLEIVSK